MAEHRVSMLSASLRRYDDPARSADPRIRRLVVQLATLEPAPAPRAHFRAELRAQLVAVAPRLVVEGPAVEQRPVARPAADAHEADAKSAGRFAGRTTRISIFRPLATITTVLAVFAMLLGGAVWMSSKSLPGDALYGLKRASENVQLATTSGDTAKGRRYLSLARTRAEEVAALLSRASAMAVGAGPSAAGGINAHTDKLVRVTLDLADSNVRDAAQLLDGHAVRAGSTDPLSVMTDWAPGQIRRLQSITDRLGTGAVHDRAAASTNLATSALTRAKALTGVLGCNCLDDTSTDELGPVPCTVCDATGAPAKQSTTSHAPNGSTTVNRASTPTDPSATNGTGSSTNGGVSQPGPNRSIPVPISGGTTVPAPSLPVPVPTLPTVLPTIPTRSASAPVISGHTCRLYVLGVCIG